MNNILEDYSINKKKYKKIKSARLLEIDNKKYILKKKKNNHNIYDYLDSRNFSYYLRPISEDNDYELYEYLEDEEKSNEDLIRVVANLHNKTTTYKEVIPDDIKKLYEKIKKTISETRSFYFNMQDILETKMYYAPEEYLLLRNISSIYDSLKYSENNIDKWYQTKAKSSKERVVRLHNNLELNHFIKSKLISWNNTKVDYPIYDFLNFYRKEFNVVEPISLYEIYNKNYKLEKDEKYLLKSLLTIPKEITFKDNHLINTQKISNEIKYLSKTRNFILKEYEKEQSIDEDKFKEQNNSI